MTEAERACERLTQPVVGMALYQKAELHRLRGELVEAEDAYRQASEFGHSPQPGLALLRLRQGRTDAAIGAIRRALDEVSNPLERARLLGPAIEIMLAVNDTPVAQRSAEELVSIAGAIATPLLTAAARHAMGSVLLAQGDCRAAVTELRDAWRLWQDLDAPYEASKTRLLIADACLELGDVDDADLERSAALRVLRELGADGHHVEPTHGTFHRQAQKGLTPREIEVLGHVASGKTNRAIAGDLYLSEKTVARHVSNIFAKLDVSSRSAATAYAYEHGLLRPPT